MALIRVSAQVIQLGMQLSGQWDNTAEANVSIDYIVPITSTSCHSALTCPADETLLLNVVLPFAGWRGVLASVEE